VFGGSLAPYAHAAAWLLWLSLEPCTLIFPWDTMLMAAGFLTLFLPTVPALPELTVSTLPYPSVSFIIRFFVSRPSSVSAASPGKARSGRGRTSSSTCSWVSCS